jgi:leader peptidase (prepilin peptidase)/N-methyltransferase
VDAISDFLSTPAAVALAVAWGAVWGSFFNVVIGRLPRGESIVRPASHCLSCAAPVRAWDNVPILSYFWLRGRCRRCGARFSARYPLVEALTALLAGALFWRFVASDAGEVVAVRLGRFAVYFAFAGALVVLAFIDLDTKRLPDVLTLPGTALFFFAAFAAHDVPWKERLIGVAAGYLFVRLIADFYYYVLRREGLGLGDGKLLAMIGAALGWRSLPVVLFAASVLGSAISIPVLLVARARRRRDSERTPESASASPTGNANANEDPGRAGPTPAGETASSDHGPSWRDAQVPFGPFLALGALVYLFAGARLWALIVPPG